MFLMKKELFIILTILLISPITAQLEVNQINSNPLIIKEVKNFAEIELEITNNGPDTKIFFYNLIGFNIIPTEHIELKNKETKQINLEIQPPERLDAKGLYSLKYYIKTSEENKTEKKIILDIIELKDAFEITAGEIDPESNSIELKFSNIKNFDFEELQTKISSPFFEIERTFPLDPYKTKTFEITLNKEEFKKLLAGFYTISAEIQYKDIETKLEGKVKFIEKDIVETQKKDFGFFINTKTITKENKGNLISDSQIIVEKNIISRLFTTFFPEPNLSERNGFEILYTWNQEIKPGEQQEIIVKTNWFFPFIIIILIVLIVVFVKKYNERDLAIEKRVAFVRTKGGEFALKITLKIKAKSTLERITVRDRIPFSMKLHESFSGETPSRIEQKSKLLEWDFNYLEPGEKRYVSYMIYSKLGVLGKFALPRASAVFEKQGKIKEAVSNRAFFIAEQPLRKEEE